MSNNKAIGFLLAGAGVMLLGLRGAGNSVQHRNYIDPGVDPKASNLMKKLRDIHGVTGSYWMGRVKGNGFTDPYHRHGARSTFIYIPKHFDSSKPFELLFFFHGLTGYFKNTNGRYEHRVTMAMREMDDSGRNYILVFPEQVWSHFTSTPKGRQRKTYDGSEQESFQTFYPSTLNIIRDHFNIKATPAQTKLIGHSAGGASLRGISKDGMMDAIKPDGIFWSDSAYGNWLCDFHQGFKDQSKSKVYIFNIIDSHPTHPYVLTNACIRRLGGTPSNYLITNLPYGRNREDLWTHSKIGNNIIQMSAQY